MPINDPGEELTGISPERFNAMVITALTGDEISDLAAAPPVDGRVVYCYESNSTYTIGHWYGWYEADSTFIDLNGLPDFFEYFSTNALKGVVDKRYATKEMWHVSATGTGAAVNNTVSGGLASIDLVTGTTTTGVAMIRIGGPLLDFSKKTLLKLKFKTPAAVTGQVVKLGVGIDTAGTGPAVTRNFGIEYCDGSANWMIHSANGTGQNNTDTTIAVAAATEYGFTIEVDPGSLITVTFDNGTIKTKSTNVPSNSTTAEDSLIKLSICNNNGSSTSRTLQILGAYLVYAIADPKWD